MDAGVLTVHAIDGEIIVLVAHPNRSWVAGQVGKATHCQVLVNDLCDCLRSWRLSLLVPADEGAHVVLHRRLLWRLMSTSNCSHRSLLDSSGRLLSSTSFGDDVGNAFALGLGVGGVLKRLSFQEQEVADILLEILIVGNAVETLGARVSNRGEEVGGAKEGVSFRAEKRAERSSSPVCNTPLTESAVRSSATIRLRKEDPRNRSRVRSSSSVK